MNELRQILHDATSGGFWNFIAYLLLIGMITTHIAYVAKSIIVYTLKLFKK